MFKIQILNNIATIGTDSLGPQYQLGESIASPDAILIRSANMHDVTLPDSVKAIIRAGAGVNNIPIEKCTERGIAVFNTPGANANAVKELVICGLFLASRGIAPGFSWLQSYQGADMETEVEKQKVSFKGPEIYGKTLGVIGLGAIGMLVANAADALGMKVIGFDPYISVDSAWKLSQNVKRAQQLSSLFSKADYISLHLPLLDETKYFLSKEKFNNMKTGMRILNFSRGPLVHDDDLLDAMQQNIVASYVTDFPNEKLVHQKGVICLPHLGASTPESEDNCAMMAIEQMKAFLEHGNIRNSVNFPEAHLARSGTRRLTITNRNVPKMVHQITNVLADTNINISDMLNKHRGGIAYNIIDVDSDVDPSLLKKIEAIDGVLAVRYLN